MNNFTHFKVSTDEQGLCFLTIDMADSETNVLATGVLEELRAVLSSIAAEKPAGLAIVSAKGNGFIAGADVKEFTAIKSFDDAFQLIRRGQEVADQIEALAFPTVAVIHGFCLGGGLELALACNYRIALDDPQTRIGLPEIKLGIHPGFGGSVRAIRVLGPMAAMGLMLTGRTLAAQQARKMGLVDQAVPKRLLQQAAVKVLQTRPKQQRPKPWVQLLNRQPFRHLVAQQMVKQVSGKANKLHYPAPYALIELWRKYGGNEKTHLLEEANSVASLSNNHTAGNLVRVFLLQDALKASADKSLIDPHHVHVIGAGVMGGDIAAWCALRGFRVTVQDTHKAGLAKTMQRAHKLFSKRFRAKTHMVNACMDRLIADDKGYGVSQADVLIEAIFEDADAKRTLYKELERKIKPQALLATNTSSIRLEALSSALSDPTRLVGLHFFNPVAKMPLVEIVKGEQTSPDVVAKAMAFARHIDKLPITVQSSPGFLVNRVLVPYLIEAVSLLEQGVPKQIIDQAATDFGMPMGPIQLADTVGLDVCLFVAGILSKDLGFSVPERLRKQVDDGNLGMKSGQGFYQYAKGKPVKEEQQAYEGNFDELQARLIKRLTDEAQACLAENIVENSDLLDAGIIFGTGFAPFRGGPLKYLQDSSALSTS